MTNHPRCQTGTRRCTINKFCLSKSVKKRKLQCKTGSRKCYNQKCYRKNTSRKSRRRFYEKYGMSKV